MVVAVCVAGIDTGKVLDCMGKPEADEDHPILKEEQVAQVRTKPDRGGLDCFVKGCTHL